MATKHKTVINLPVELGEVCYCMIGSKVVKGVLRGFDYILGREPLLHVLVNEDGEDVGYNIDPDNAFESWEDLQAYLMNLALNENYT